MKAIVKIISILSFMAVSKGVAQIDTSYRNKTKPLPDSIAPPQEKMPTQNNTGNPAPMPNSQNNNGNTVPMPTQPLPPTQPSQPVNPTSPKSNSQKKIM